MDAGKRRNPPTRHTQDLGHTRRHWLRQLGVAGAALALGGCASWIGREPLRVSVAGLEPLPSEGLELRMALKLRVQNPNDAALDYDGLAIELDVHGARFASGVSNAHGRIGRFEEALITVPMTISPFAIARQALDLTQTRNPRIDYTLRGHLAGTGLGGMHFESSGQLDLPRGLGID